MRGKMRLNASIKSNQIRASVIPKLLIGCHIIVARD